MSTCGIIAEYNPFHNGHKLQLDLVSKKYENIIVLMSGSFVQRGDVAIIDKWTRTNTALLNGASLVLELPVAFSLSTAQRFAYGGVGILNALGVVDALCFGSECGDINLLKSAAKSLINETDEIKEKINELMKKGCSYAAAREAAFFNIIPKSLLNSSNNILALEYIKELMKINSTILPITHKREENQYNDKNLGIFYSSATAIRESISDFSAISSQIPGNTHDILTNATLHHGYNLDKIMMYHLKKNGVSSFNDIFDVSEGIENRILNSVSSASSIDEISEAVSTKRYTKAKVRRILFSSLLGIKKNTLSEIPSYIRVLGADKKGLELLSKIKKSSNLKIVTKVADFKESCEHFKQDILSTDIYSLSADQNECFGLDYKTSPIILS